MSDIESRLSKAEERIDQQARMIQLLLQATGLAKPTRKRPREPEATPPVKRQTPERLIISTDGSCLANGSATAHAGYAAVSSDGRRVSGVPPGAATNNRAEMAGIVAALEMAGSAPDLLIRSDSQYCVKGCNEWRHNWARNGWRTANKKPVKNKDLWQRISELAEERKAAGLATEIVWVRGHAGDAGNEAADALAGSAARNNERNRFV